MLEGKVSERVFDDFVCRCAVPMASRLPAIDIIVSFNDNSLVPNRTGSSRGPALCLPRCDGSCVSGGFRPR